MTILGVCTGRSNQRSMTGKSLATGGLSSLGVMTAVSSLPRHESSGTVALNIKRKFAPSRNANRTTTQLQAAGLSLLGTERDRLLRRDTRHLNIVELVAEQKGGAWHLARVSSTTSTGASTDLRFVSDMGADYVKSAAAYIADTYRGEDGMVISDEEVQDIERSLVRVLDLCDAGNLGTALSYEDARFPGDERDDAKRASHAEDAVDMGLEEGDDADIGAFFDDEEHDASFWLALTQTKWKSSAFKVTWLLCSRR